VRHGHPGATRKAARNGRLRRPYGGAGQGVGVVVLRGGQIGQLQRAAFVMRQRFPAPGQQASALPKLLSHSG